MAALAQLFLVWFSVSLPLQQSYCDNKYGFFPPLDQSWSGFQSLCQSTVCLRSVDGFWRSRLRLLDVPQLSAVAMEAGFVVPVTVSEEAASLLASTERSCMESAISCTALLSSETQRYHMKFLYLHKCCSLTHLEALKFSKRYDRTNSSYSFAFRQQTHWQTLAYSKTWDT